MPSLAPARTPNTSHPVCTGSIHGAEPKICPREHLILDDGASGVRGQHRRDDAVGHFWKRIGRQFILAARTQRREMNNGARRYG